MGLRPMESEAGERLFDRAIPASHCVVTIADPHIVIPAKAGIHRLRRVKVKMDPRFRGDDVCLLDADATSGDSNGNPITPWSRSLIHPT